MKSLRIALGVIIALIVCLFTVALTSSNWITPALARGGNPAPSASEPIILSVVKILLAICLPPFLNHIRV